MRLLRSSLFTRTAILLLVMAAVPACLVSIMQIRIVKKALADDFRNVKSKMAERTAKSASDYINSVTGLLVTIGESNEFTSLRKAEYSAVCRRVLESHPVIAGLTLYNSDGSWLFGMERTPGTIDEKDRIASLNDYLRETIRRNGKFRGGTIRAANHPAIELFVPLRRRDNRQVVGYLRSIVSLLALSENLEDAKIGATSEFFIVDYKGRPVAHSSFKKYFREDINATIDPAIEDRISKLGPYQSWSGSLKLGDGRKTVAALYKMEDLPWITGSLQEEWEAFVVMIAMRQKLAEIILAGCIFGLLMALFFASRISSPVRSLTRAVRQMVAADFSQAPTEPLPKPNNEIGELASAFEVMGKVIANRTQELMHAQTDLQRFNTELEARVEARTRELRATQDELIKQERLAAIGQMASVVGHELRNPLSVINNSLYVIKTRQETLNTPENPLDAKVAKHMQIIEGELLVANQIISEILTFARTRELQTREIDLHEFLEEITSLLNIPEKIVLEKSYAPQPIKLMLDPDEMRQVIRNIIGNGFDAMPSGGTFRLETTVNGRYAIITMQDSGQGIPADVVAKIFTPFFTTKSKGTGLGLAVVKKVMDRHNGEVDVQSTVGKGTVFHLKLPLI